MRRFPLALRCYLLAMGLAGTVALAGSWLIEYNQRQASLPVVGGLAILVLIFQVYPEHRVPGAKLSFSTVAFFAAVLVMPVRVSVTTVVGTMLIAEIWGSRPWYEVMFNVSCVGVEIFLAGTLNALLSPGTPFVTVPHAAVVTAGLAHVTNVSTVAGAIAAQRGIRYWAVLREMLAADWRQHVMMFAAGGLLAVSLANSWLWALPALLLTLYSIGPLRERCRFHLLRLVGRSPAN